MQVTVENNRMYILNLIVGILVLLIGFRIIDGKWKNEDVRKKNEKRLKITGIFVIIIGIIRFIWEIVIK